MVIYLIQIEIIVTNDEKLLLSKFLNSNDTIVEVFINNLCFSNETSEIKIQKLEKMLSLISEKGLVEEVKPFLENLFNTITNDSMKLVIGNFINEIPSQAPAPTPLALQKLQKSDESRNPSG